MDWKKSPGFWAVLRLWLNGNVSWQTITMYQSLERPMTEQERQRLLACMPLTPSPFRPFRKYQYGLQVIGETFGVLLMVSLLLWDGKLRAAHVIAGAIGLLAIWWLLHLKSRVLTPLRRYREANQRVLDFRNALTAAQTVRVHCVESNAVVEVTGDDVYVCLFDVGENRTYWIDPYWMIPGRPPPNWPNRKFEVVEVPGWKDEIGPFGLGKKLLPRETFEFRDLFEYYVYEPPADGLIDQLLDDFLQSAQARNRSGREASAT